MFPWERYGCQSPLLKSCVTISDRLRSVLSRDMLNNFWTLLRVGADINTRDRYGRTPLHLVLYWKKDIEIVKAVLYAGADPNAYDFYGQPPLHAAIYSNSSPAIIETLLNAGAEIELPDSIGMTPLIKSINLSKNIEVIRTLLSAGANVTLINNPLVEALKAKADPEVIRLLIIAGASVNYSSTKFPPIAYAVKNNDLEVVKLLLEAGAATNFLHPATDGTLLHFVKVPGVAQELIRYGMNVNAEDYNGITPLHFAVFYDLYEVATTLINAGADVHSLATYRRDNCLHLAKSRPMVRLLVSHGVDINLRNLEGATPLHSLGGYINVLPYLNFDDDSYFENSNLGISAIKKMIKYGADVNATDLYDLDVLQLVVCVGCPKAVMYMIQRDVEVYWEKLFYLRMLDRYSIKLLAKEYLIGNVIAEDIYEALTPRMGYLRDFMQECIDEFDVMKQEKINCHKTIFYYVMEIAPNIKPLKLCPHFELNEDLCRALFPIYHKHVAMRLNLCYRRAGMFEILEALDVSVPTAEGKGVVRLHDYCKFAIADFLSNEDLYYYLIALGWKEPKNTISPKSMYCGSTPPPPPLIHCDMFCYIEPIDYT